MANDDTISSALTELDSIANAAMTSAEREVRARPVLSSVALTLDDVCEAMKQSELPWNQRKAAAFGITPEQWLVALETGGVPDCTTLDNLLAAIHQAEAAAGMLRAGYRPERDASGKLSWSR